MKKLLIFIILLISINCFAELKGVIEVAKSTNYIEDLSFFNFELDYTYEIFKIKNTIYGGSRVWYYSEHSFKRPIKGYPFRDIYTLGYKVQYDIFYFKVDHFCNHAVYSTELKNKWYSNKWNETMTSYIFGVEFKIK